MSSSTVEWPSELIDVLRQLTRQHQFDFLKISVILQQYCLHHQSSHVQGFAAHVDEATCRAQFALDYEQGMKRKKEQEMRLPPAPVARGINDGKSMPPKVSDDTSLISSSSSSSIGIELESSSTSTTEASATTVSASTNELYNDMTVSEIFALSEKLQAENLKRQDAVFERVLQSMGSLTASTEAIHDPNYVMVKSIYEDKKRTREKKEIDRLKKLQEAEEQRELDEQREQLRQRFNDCSEETLQMVPSTVAEGKISLTNFGFELEDDEDEDIATGDGTRMPFDIDAVLGSMEFNALLNEVERDLADTPASENSELAEVFAFLDAAKAEESSANRSHSSSGAKSGSHYRPVDGILDDASFLEFVNSTHKLESSRGAKKTSTSNASASSSRTPSKASSTPAKAPVATPTKSSSSSTSTPAAGAVVASAIAPTKSASTSTPIKSSAPTQVPAGNSPAPTAVATNPSTTSKPSSLPATTTVKTSTPSREPTSTPSRKPQTSTTNSTPTPEVVSAAPTSTVKAKGLLYKSTKPEADDDDDEDDDLDKLRRTMKQQAQMLAKAPPTTPQAPSTVSAAGASPVRVDKSESEKIAEKHEPKTTAIEAAIVQSSPIESIAHSLPSLVASGVDQVHIPAAPPVETNLENQPAAAHVTGSLLASGRQKRDPADKKTPMTASRPRKDIKA